VSRKLVYLMVLVVVLMEVLGVLTNVHKGEAASGTIYIKANGDVEGTDKIQRDGDTYTLTDNIYDSIVVERDNIVVDGVGYAIQGTGTVGTAIDLSYRSNVTVRNVKISGFTGGIQLYSSSGNTLSNTTITGPIDSFPGLEGGISLEASSGNTIVNNNISNFRFAGIYLQRFSSENTLTGNNISSSAQYPLVFLRDGIHLYSSSSNEINNNVFANSGLFVRYSYNNSIENNKVNGKSLLYFEGISNYMIKGTEHVAGQIIVVNSYNITIENMDLSSTNIGIEFFETGSSRITNCNLTSIADGIHLGASSNNIIENNILSDNEIMVTESKNNIIMNNILLSTDLHVHHYSSTANVGIHILRNNFTQCKLVLDRSSDNYIYFNNFISSDVESAVYKTANIWNTPLKIAYVYEDNSYINNLGNYWGDYNGSDSNNDGVCDLPCNIVWDDKDNNPLMKTFGYYTFLGEINVYDVFWESTNYPVSVYSNSSVTQFNFEQSLAQMSFEVFGETATVGFCNVTIPKALLKDNPWTVKIDDEPWAFTTSDNTTHSFIYFTYAHSSSHQVVIEGTWVVPEFPSFLILPLFMIATLLAVIVYRRKHVQP